MEERRGWWRFSAGSAASIRRGGRFLAASRLDNRWHWGKVDTLAIGARTGSAEAWASGTRERQLSESEMLASECKVEVLDLDVWEVAIEKTEEEGEEAAEEDEREAS